MIKLNELEIEAVNGGMSLFSAPAFVAVLTRPTPEPLDIPVPMVRPS